MPRVSFDGFKDPVRRPRYIIWTGVGVLVLAAVMIVALGVTSTRWFCAEGCHKVQDDTILAYEASPHSEISCMACHMPVNANPVVFILHKAEALGELYLTVTDNFELPLNAESEVGLTMASTQCTQCHNLELRPVTPSAGILIDHPVHEENEVTCGICHNRTAHVENFELTLKDPNTGEPNRKHEDFMSMTACFRCHTQGAKSEGLKAPGTCSACHTPGFELKPESHRADGFYPSGHAELAKKEQARVAKASGEGTGAAEAGEVSSEAASEEESGGHGEEGIGPSLPKVETINECSTCHAEKFCSDCHGLEMPHPADFTKEHGQLGKEKPQTCSRCHGNADRFCDDCHHGSELEYESRDTRPWLQAHPTAVKELGAETCFDCHDPTYCAYCHVNGPEASRAQQ